MQEITINVTEEHIEKGSSSSAYRCPVARAFNDKFKLKGYRTVVGRYNYMVEISDKTSIHGKLPENVTSKIIKHDSEIEPMKPFQFTIKIPDDVKIT